MVRTQSDTTFFRLAIISAGVAMSMPCYSPAVEPIIREILENSQNRKKVSQPTLHDIKAACYEEFTDDQISDLLSRQPNSVHLSIELPAR